MIAAATTTAATAKMPRLTLVKISAARSAPPAPPAQAIRAVGPLATSSANAPSSSTHRPCGCIGSLASTVRVEKAAIIPVTPSARRPVNRCAARPNRRLEATQTTMTMVRLASVVTACPVSENRPPNSS